MLRTVRSRAISPRKGVAVRVTIRPGLLGAVAAPPPIDTMMAAVTNIAAPPRPASTATIRLLMCIIGTCIPSDCSSATTRSSRTGWRQPANNRVPTASLYAADAQPEATVVASRCRLPRQPNSRVTAVVAELAVGDGEPTRVDATPAAAGAPPPEAGYRLDKLHSLRPTRTQFRGVHRRCLRTRCTMSLCLVERVPKHVPNSANLTS